MCVCVQPPLLQMSGAASAGEPAQPDVELPPYTGQEELTALVCYKCDAFKSPKSWVSLMEHLRRMHGISWKSVAGTPLHTLARKDQNVKDKNLYGAKRDKAAGKADGVQPEPAEPADGLQPLPEAGTPSAEWRAFWVKVDPSGTPVMPLELQEMVEQPLQVAPKFWKPTCKAIARPTSAQSTGPQARHAPSQPASVTANLQDPLAVISGNTSEQQGRGAAEVIATLVTALQRLAPMGQPQLQQREPTRLIVAIAERAAAWHPEMLQPGAKRHMWPLRGVETVDVSTCMINFERFLRNLSLKPKSIGIAMSGTNYFLSLLTVDGDHTSLAGIVAAVYTSNLAASVFDLPLMDPSRSWACKIVAALHGHLCPFLLAECGRKQYDDTARCIRQLQSEFLVPRTKACNKAKKRRMRAKKKEEAIRLKDMPPVEAMKSAAYQAIVDLHVINRHCKTAGKMSAKLQASATAAMVGNPWRRQCSGCEAKGRQASTFEAHVCRVAQSAQCSSVHLCAWISTGCELEHVLLWLSDCMLKVAAWRSANFSFVACAAPQA